MNEDDMKIEDYPLEPIITYKMDSLQAKAYKVMILWLVLSRKAFPDYKFGHNSLPKGDPRKSIVWKFCYKLVRETADKLRDDELKLYVWAQLMVLKAIDDNGVHPLIDPICLVSKQAWARWCIWKKKYAMRGAAQTMKQAEVTEDDKKVMADLDRTKAYFEKSFGHTPSFDEMKVALENRALIRWTKLRKVTPYYLTTSPWVKRLLDGKDASLYFEMDLSQYQPTTVIAEHFSKLFPLEL